MNIIYVHGLNSNAQAKKASLLKAYCAEHCPEIQVHCPDLNLPTHQAMALLREMVQQLDKPALIGSSLGGFFATCLAHELGCPTLLLNPSLYPEQSLCNRVEKPLNHYQADDVLYVTKDGWQVYLSDLTWFAQHRPATLQHQSRFAVLLKTGDDTLDYAVALRYFYLQGVPLSSIWLEEGGDHVVSDFSEKIPQVLEFFRQQWTIS